MYRAIAAPAFADVSFDSGKLGAPAQNKEATDLPSTFFKTGVCQLWVTCCASLVRDHDLFGFISEGFSLFQIDESSCRLYHTLTYCTSSQATSWKRSWDMIQTPKTWVTKSRRAQRVRAQPPEFSNPQLHVTSIALLALQGRNTAVPI